jgi:single-strand DNA-binding protein
MNTTVLDGNLVRDPKIATSAGGKLVANFRIAVDRRYKSEGRPTTDYFDCIAFDSQASALRYLGKGDGLVIRGRIENKEPYKNKNGELVKEDIIVVEEVSFSKKRSSNRPLEQPETVVTSSKSGKTTTVDNSKQASKPPLTEDEYLKYLDEIGYGADIEGM